MSPVAPRCSRTPDLAASRGSPCPNQPVPRNTYPLHVPDSKLQVQMLHDRVLVRARPLPETGIAPR
jgi:hypothetical protein